jgi:hypothetical protein
MSWKKKRERSEKDKIDNTMPFTQKGLTARKSCEQLRGGGNRN